MPPKEDSQRPPPRPPKIPKISEDIKKETHIQMSASWGIGGSDPNAIIAQRAKEIELGIRPHPDGTFTTSKHPAHRNIYGDNDAATARPAPPAVPAKQKRRIRILSLDGGGIRGYSTLVILAELMHLLHVELYGKPPASPQDLPLPADYFDIIGGNGTGGLIALMLGRMRMNVEDAKQWYVELTRYVFITDKTVMGVPYGKTLFKKERLEQAIRECVGESTRHDNEPIQPPSISGSPPPPRHRRRVSEGRGSISAPNRLTRKDSTNSNSTIRPIAIGGAYANTPRGNQHALLRDPRDGATKTFVTTTYKGSSRNAPPVLLRTYPSRVESDPCPNATIWEAGRATCATLSAFKPITIEQNTFLDEGHGQYNPAVAVLTEATENEFPDCEVGVFISVGTGKRNTKGVVQEERPKWWEGVVSSPFENWTEARRRLIRKLEECEKVHKRLVGEEGGRSILVEKGVDRDNYYRFNVDVGVGEFAMNEWNRLPEVSTGTRRYIGERKTHKLIKEAAFKLADIERENRNSFFANGGIDFSSQAAPAGPAPSYNTYTNAFQPPPNIAELPAEIDQAISTWSPTQAQAKPVYSRPATTVAPPVPPPPPQQPYQSAPPPAEPVPIYAQPSHVEQWASTVAPLQVNRPDPPIIRVTSPTTVAGDSDEDERDESVGIGRGRRFNRGRGGSLSMRGGRGVPYPIGEH